MFTILQDAARRAQATLIGDAAGALALVVMLLVVLNSPVFA